MTPVSATSATVDDWARASAPLPSRTKRSKPPPSFRCFHIVGLLQTAIYLARPNRPASAAGDQPRGSEFYVPPIAIGEQHPSGARDGSARQLQAWVRRRCDRESAAQAIHAPTARAQGCKCECRGGSGEDRSVQGRLEPGPYAHPAREQEQ